MDAAGLSGREMVTETDVRDVLAQVVDPEIPILTIEDMGILRSIEVDGDAVSVDITPTYSGCPAMDLIKDQVRLALLAAGYSRVNVNLVYSPAWTTDWMSAAGKEKLASIGISPPDQSPVTCPQCASTTTRTISEFGSTACKALMVCGECGEPFSRFKAI